MHVHKTRIKELMVMVFFHRLALEALGGHQTLRMTLKLIRLR